MLEHTQNNELCCKWCMMYVSFPEGWSFFPQSWRIMANGFHLNPHPTFCLSSLQVVNILYTQAERDLKWNLTAQCFTITHHQNPNQPVQYRVSTPYMMIVTEPNWQVRFTEWASIWALVKITSKNSTYRLYVEPCHVLHSTNPQHSLHSEPEEGKVSVWGIEEFF